MIELFSSNVEQIGLQRHAYGLSPLVNFLEGQGINCKPLFKTANISPGSLGDPNALMELKQEQKFIMAAIEAFGKPGLGLSVGPHFHLNAYGVLGVAMISSSSLQEGLVTLNGLHALTWTRLHWRQSVEEGIAIMEAREVEPLEPCLNYMLERDFCGFRMMCNEMLGQSMPLREIHFTFSRPEYADEYDAVFKCPVIFNAERNEILFDAYWLQTPLPQANQAVWQVCNAQCEDMLVRLAKDNSYAKMIEYLVVDGGGHFLSLQQVAKKMNTSPRTLRRKLAQEGTSFQEVLKCVRSSLAKQLLLSGKLSIAQVAERLDYSDASAFCHAFKRWTGKPPTDFC